MTSFVDEVVELRHTFPLDNRSPMLHTMPRITRRYSCVWFRFASVQYRLFVAHADVFDLSLLRSEGYFYDWNAYDTEYVFHTLIIDRDNGSVRERKREVNVCFEPASSVLQQSLELLSLLHRPMSDLPRDQCESLTMLPFSIHRTEVRSLSSHLD